MATVTRDGAAPSGRLSRTDTLRRASTLASWWSDTMVTCGLTHETTSAAGVMGAMSPRVIHAELGANPYLMIRLVPGQTADDLRGHSDRIAAGLGVNRVEVENRRHQVARIWLDPEDPLAESFAVPPALSVGTWPVTFGKLATGGMLRESFENCGHIAVQGQTRSGKTAFTYGLLSQVAGASGIEVSGIDPTGKLLGPWVGHHQGAPEICADSAYQAMESTSAALVADMRERIAAIPRDEDKLPAASGHRLRLVLLEEWANALTIASIAKGKAQGKDTDLGRNVMMLLAECHKARMRVVMLCQRFDGGLVGGFNRDNFSHRFSYRTGSKDGIKMLHDGVDDLVAQGHSVEMPGIALAQTPTIPLQRMKSPLIHSYRAYVRAVDRAKPGADSVAA